MPSLFFVPRRPTTNTHDHRVLQVVSERIKSNLKTLDNVPCEGMRCSKRMTSKVCAGCKSASYCSVECQRSDWRLHRLACKPRPVHMKHFLSILICNQILGRLLHAVFIAHFKLDEKTQVGPSSEPICIGTSGIMVPHGWGTGGGMYQTVPARPPPIAISPSGINSSGRRRKAGVEVFLQIARFAYLSDTSRPGTFNHEHKRAWEHVSSLGDVNGALSEDDSVHFIGLLLLYDGFQKDKQNIIRLPIFKKDFDAFRNGTYFSAAESVFGEPIPRPLTTQGLIQYINRHIDADIENYFHLRTFLKPDKATLLTWGQDVLRILTTRENLEKEEVIQCLRVYNPDGSKLNLRSA